MFYKDFSVSSTIMIIISVVAGNNKFSYHNHISSVEFSQNMYRFVKYLKKKKKTTATATNLIVSFYAQSI